MKRFRLPVFVLISLREMPDILRSKMSTLHQAGVESARLAR
jgi:hypothetical protein